MNVRTVLSQRDNRYNEKGEQMKQIEKYFIFAILVTIISGCATSTGVFSAGKDTFTVIESANTNITTLGKLKKRAYTKANTYCEKRGKVMQPIATETGESPFLNFELRFLALDPNDPDVSRPILEPTADTMIDVKVH